MQSNGFTRISLKSYPRWKTRLLWACLALTAAVNAHDTSTSQPATANYSSSAGYLRSLAEPYQKKLDEFVLAAHKGELNVVLKMISRIALQRNGGPGIIEFLSSEVIPFFETHEYVHAVSAMNPAGSSGGVSGYWFDVYSVDHKGQLRPFSVVVINEGSGYSIANVLVNQCRPNRHPFCPQGYAR